MLYIDDRLTALRLAKVFLALLSLFLKSFCALLSLLITLPRYMKLFLHSSVSPAIVRCAPKVVLIHITFVFGGLSSSPTCFAAFHT